MSARWWLLPGARQARGAGHGAASEAGDALWHLPRTPGYRALRGRRMVTSRDPGWRALGGIEGEGFQPRLVVFGSQARTTHSRLSEPPG